MPRDVGEVGVENNATSFLHRSSRCGTTRARAQGPVEPMNSPAVAFLKNVKGNKFVVTTLVGQIVYVLHGFVLSTSILMEFQFKVLYFIIYYDYTRLIIIQIDRNMRRVS